MYPGVNYGGGNSFNSEAPEFELKGWARACPFFLLCDNLGVRDPDLTFKVASTTTQVLSRDWVEKMRKDFLTLMKNMPRVNDYRTGIKLKEAFTIYQRRFKELFFDRFMNEGLKYHFEEMGLSESTARYLDSKLRSPAWDFYIDLSLPLNRKDKYWSEEQRFHQFKEELPKWEARIKRKAQVFWKLMKEALEATERASPGGLRVQVPVDDKTELEGFQVVIRGFKPWEEFHHAVLERVKAGLKIYRQNAASRMPLLLKMRVPLILDFEINLNKGGEYDGGVIRIYASGIMRHHPAKFAHVLAHEMGHHVYETYLSGDAIKFWKTAIEGNYTDLDIGELLRKWPGDAWLHELSEYLGDTDPILALQAMALEYNKSVSQNLENKQDFEALYNSGVRTLKVPAIPITGYANKNPEEAFCEAIGLLVAYGPRALHEVIRFWIKTILPSEIKLASTELNPACTLAKVAARYMKSAGYFQVGDEILYGKYKNKRGIIRSLSVDERGVPIVEIEPVPKGRKQNKTLGLFNIWHADPEKRKGLGT